MFYQSRSQKHLSAKWANKRANWEDVLNAIKDNNFLSFSGVYRETRECVCWVHNCYKEVNNHRMAATTCWRTLELGLQQGWTGKLPTFQNWLKVWGSTGLERKYALPHKVVPREWLQMSCFSLILTHFLT